MPVVERVERLLVVPAEVVFDGYVEPG